MHRKQKEQLRGIWMEYLSQEDQIEEIQVGDTQQNEMSQGAEVQSVKCKYNRIEHIRKIEKAAIIARKKEKSYIHIGGFIVRKAAVYLILIIGILTSSLSVKAVREEIKDFIIKISSDGDAEIKTPRKTTNQIPYVVQQFYDLKWLPAGYRYRQFDSDNYSSNGDIIMDKALMGGPTGVTKTYTKGDGILEEAIFFTQMAGEISMLSTELQELDEIHVLGKKGIYEKMGGYHSIYCSLDGYIFDVNAPISISKKELIRLVNSITLNEESVRVAKRLREDKDSYLYFIEERLKEITEQEAIQKEKL